MEIWTQFQVGKKTTNAETYRVSTRPCFFFSVDVATKGSIALNTRNIYYTDSAKTKTQYGLKITVESWIFIQFVCIYYRRSFIAKVDWIMLNQLRRTILILIFNFSKTLASIGKLLTLHCFLYCINERILSSDFPLRIFQVFRRYPGDFQIKILWETYCRLNWAARTNFFGLETK